MRLLFHCSLLAVLLGMVPSFVNAAQRPLSELPEPYEIPEDPPRSFDEIRDVVGTNAVTYDGEIYEDVSQRAECGGWDMSRSVEGTIPAVTGVPGRRGTWNGNIRSGLAKRNEGGSENASENGLLGDGFLFPRTNEARGWSTACEPGNPPFLDDEPPCVDPELGASTPERCTQMCHRLNRWQYPVWVVVWELWVTDDEGNRVLADSQYCQQHGKGEKDYNRDPMAGDCCERGGNGEEAPNCTMKYNGGDDNDPLSDPGIPEDAECNTPPGEGYTKADLDGLYDVGTPGIPDEDALWAGWHYCCTSEHVDQMDYELCSLEDGAQCAQHVDENRNCMRCAGDGVPSANGGNDFNDEPIERGVGQREELGCRGSPDSSPGEGVINRGTYVSYYREYDAGYQRNALPQVQSDVSARQNVPVACYGFYEEFDPKKRKTESSDARCVIAAYTESTEFRNFYNTQRGKGNFGDERPTEDPDPGAAENMRDQDFRSDEDLWYQNLGGAMSLLNGPVFQEDLDEDFTRALMQLDVARQKASVQLDQSRPISSGAYLRAFDDTVSNERGDARTVTEWWQRQQTAVQKLVHPPVVHLVLPAGWSIGLDPDDPFLERNTAPEPPDQPPTPDGPVIDPRREPVELQLELREDLLGEIAGFLRRALLLRVEQRPVTIVVPMGSAEDFRGYKEQWIRWKKTQENKSIAVPPEADVLIAKLEEYALRADEVRVLRTELPRILAGIMSRQGQAIATVQEWVEANLAAYNAFLERRREQADLLYAWQAVADVYRQFHDVTNMPWCKNDRFTTPIYSLLDPWLPGRPELNGFVSASLDRLPDLGELPIRRPTDLFMDFTNVRLATGAVILPVLRPVQVTADHETLVGPSPNTHPSKVVIPDLPDLPPVPSIADAVVQRFPEIGAGEISVRYPDITMPEGVAETFDRIRATLEQMDAAYGKFWSAVTKPRCGTPEAAKRCEQESDADCCVAPGTEKYCAGWGEDTCVHPEMDLLERFTRIGARPAILLKEDFLAAGGDRRSGDDTAFPPCDPSDWACLELHAEETYPRTGWSAKATLPDEEAKLDALRVRMFEETLQRPGTPPEDRFVYSRIRNDILPSFDARPPIPLLPSPGAASASSASSAGSQASSSSSASPR